jgi:hypothetical protein
MSDIESNVDDNIVAINLQALRSRINALRFYAELENGENDEAEIAYYRFLISSSQLSQVPVGKEMYRVPKSKHEQHKATTYRSLNVKNFR